MAKRPHVVQTSSSSHDPYRGTSSPGLSSTTGGSTSAPTEQVTVEQVPDGSVTDVLSWLREYPVGSPERAARADAVRAAEEARDTPRKSVLDALDTD